MEEYQWVRDKQFFSQGSRACRHASPRCVDQHLVVPRLRGVARTSSTQLDTARIEQSTRVTFWLSTGEGTRPLTITTIGAGDNHQPPLNDPRCSKPSRWRQPPRETSESRSETRIPSATRCNHSSKCTWNHSQSHYDEESMMEMSGRALAKLIRLLCQCKRQRE